METVDLKPEEIRQLVEAAIAYPEIERVIVFGSRVLGNAKPGSDVDIALVGSSITPQIVSKVRDFLEEETLLPYFFDVIHFEGIVNNSLRQHIIDHGKVIYHAGSI